MISYEEFVVNEATLIKYKKAWAKINIAKYIKAHGTEPPLSMAESFYRIPSYAMEKLKRNEYARYYEKFGLYDDSQIITPPDNPNRDDENDNKGWFRLSKYSGTGQEEITIIGEPSKDNKTRAVRIIGKAENENGKVRTEFIIMQYGDDVYDIFGKWVTREEIDEMLNEDGIGVVDHDAFIHFSYPTNVTEFTTKATILPYGYPENSNWEIEIDCNVSIDELFEDEEPEPTPEPIPIVASFNVSEIDYNSTSLWLSVGNSSNWSVSTDADWVTIGEISDEINVIISFDKNTGNEDRIAQFIVTDNENNTTCAVSITQKYNVVENDSNTDPRQYYWIE